MGDSSILLGASQSCLIFHQPKLTLRFSSSPLITYHSTTRRHFKPLFAVSSSDSPVITVSSPVVSSKDELDTTGGGGGGAGFGSGGGGGGGGGGNGGGDSGGSSEGTGGESEDHKKKMEWSLSQKLTIGFAAIVGLGGVMGYMKTGSKMSLTAGGVSAAALYFVFTQLPVHPVLASSIGLAVSTVLLGVMGSRFKKSGKIFPAGVVSLTSLIMAGGYVHGIIRTLTH